MKLLIVGDLHGQMPEIYFNDFDAIIAPGDFCSDAVRKYMFQALKERIANPNSKAEWYDLMGKEIAKDAIEKSLSDGRVILEKLNSFNKPIYIVPGNWDWTKDKESKWGFLKIDHYKILTQKLNNLVNVHHKILDLGDYQIIGHGISSGPEYPQYKEDLARFTPEELVKKKKKYDQLYKEVDKLFIKASKPVIFLSHNVPYNTPIDAINNPDSPRNGYHYGSLITREMIDKHQPLVCIGGHMHEHFTKCMLDQTTCINAGFGSHVNTFLELDGNNIRQLVFHDEKKVY